MRKFLLLILSVVVGCTSDEPTKTSLFEDDHAVAAHWPSDLSDLTSKLRSRLERTDSAADKTNFKEIQDLIGWTAEIAADTNLSEADWMPIYEKSEAIAANLRSAAGSLTTDDRRQIDSLCELIDESIPKISDNLPVLKARDL